jgi:hypothetical protein
MFVACGTSSGLIRRIEANSVHGSGDNSEPRHQPAHHEARPNQRLSVPLGSRHSFAEWAVAPHPIRRCRFPPALDT